MNKTLLSIIFDTDTLIDLGVIYIGDFGEHDGYEERLFITDTEQYFIYGIGGVDSIYKEPTIKLLTDEQADEWKSENNLSLYMTSI